MRQKVSSEEYYDELKFYIDDGLEDSISGNVDWQKKSYALSAGSRTLKWVYVKNGSESAGDDCGWVDALTVGTDSLVGVPGDYAEALDCNLKFTSTGYSESTWTIASGMDEDYYYDADSAYTDCSLPSGEESCLQTIVESDSSETVKFYWKVSCETDYDYLEFYIDDTLQNGRITGEVDWQQKSYPVNSGIHILKWRYISGGGTGDHCGWVDFVQWTGPSPDQDTSNWQEIAYKHDVDGRRIEKKVDGYSTRYVHDGDHVIAEYDGNNNLLRKYIYGPGVDQPVCMIEVADSNATYYYHFDAHGSVVALSDSSGDTVQTYEYSVYGEVAVEDANHTNPYMFAGRRYDIEIGLYYNRARYYNPYTGRFLQADFIGYTDGMNLYKYCRNNPLTFTDPSGLQGSPRGHLYDPCDWNDLDWGDPHPCPLGEALAGIGGIGPIDAITAALLGFEALERADDAFPNDPNKANAYRHCWWSCRMAQVMDPNTAREAGKIHEDCVPANDRDTDERNNEWGIACYDRDCDICCRDYMRKGYVK